MVRLDGGSLDSLQVEATAEHGPTLGDIILFFRIWRVLRFSIGLIVQQHVVEQLGLFALLRQVGRL